MFYAVVLLNKKIFFKVYQLVQETFGRFSQFFTNNLILIIPEGRVISLHNFQSVGFFGKPEISKILQEIVVSDDSSKTFPWYILAMTAKQHLFV